MDKKNGKTNLGIEYQGTPIADLSKKRLIELLSSLVIYSKNLEAEVRELKQGTIIGNINET